MKLRRISATLGPTNTGKTFSAIKKLLHYNSGVIGFPLRLLARENYELVKKQVGQEKVALVTGEEKVIPKDAKYFFCTVESIPDQRFEFLAIDEIQLCADFERGHLFTEKLLNRNGIKETMFLGSLSMEKILLKIFPSITINRKPRLSKLSYCGYKNLSRLPNRSAVIAFSIIDVYEIANRIKQSHGGVSVVMGALSPDVRNAQVKLFEDGKVNHIVATDAIGLGLNLNIKNIFFSSLIKFDGIRERKISNDEISQIAGRAGRYIHDGFFGTTGNLKFLSDELVSFVENYEYSEVEKIFWRNSSLNFSTQKDLVNSISKKNEKEYFLVKKNASDQRYLKILLNDKFIKNNIKNSYELKILWELCRTPDYSRELDEFHCRFLKKVFIFLVSKQKLISADWIDKELEKIKKKTRKISELNYKISQIRKWSFLAFKSNWMEDTEKFRNKIKSIELDLSLILHSQLINEFVGEFTNKKQILDIKSSDSPIVKIDEKKFIKFGKEKIGELKGLFHNISPSFSKNNIYNNKILKNSLICSAKTVFASFFQSDFKEFNFKISGEILWRKNIIAKLFKSSDIFNPKIKIICDEFFLIYREKIESKLFNCFRFFLSKNLSFISKINALKNPSQSMRAVTYSLIENLGHCKKDEIKSFYDVLLPDEISNLKKAGFRSGVFFAFFNDKKARLFRQILINVFFESQLNNFLDKGVYNVDRLINSKKIGIYKKMGFYMIKVNKKYYLVHFDYLENLYRKNFYLKNKFGAYKPRNKLEKNILENTKIRFIEDSNI